MFVMPAPAATAASIEPAVLQRTLRPGQLGGSSSSWLSISLMNWPIFAAAALGLLVLNSDRGRLVLAIIEETSKIPFG